MKIRALAILSLTVLSLSAVSAFADFRPGRVRAGMYAEMFSTEASGIYENVKEAKVYLNYEDGKAQPVSITVSMPGSERNAVIDILKIKTSSCGDTYSAMAVAGLGIATTEVTLVDYSNIRCRMHVENPWHVTIQSFDNAGQKSELKLEGKPQHLAVTL